MLGQKQQNADFVSPGWFSVFAHPREWRRPAVGQLESLGVRVPGEGQAASKGELSCCWKCHSSK